MNCLYPAYPLITLDPFTSIWSPSQCLNAKNTIYWTGRKMPIYLYVTVDGKRFCLMGKGRNALPQKSVNVLPLNTEYTFSGNGWKVSLNFRTPMRLDETETLAYPFSYIDYSFSAEDGRDHDVAFTCRVSEKICYNRLSRVVANTMVINGSNAAKMGRKKQAPLSMEGDSVNIDWGYAYLTAENSTCHIGKNPFHMSISCKTEYKATQNVNGFFVFAYDDIYSIEYFGTKIQGYWHTKFSDITEAIAFAVAEHDAILSRAKEFESRLLSDASDFGDDYVRIISIAYRQVIAAHKLIADENGELLYLSKECHSNGCINTVDVSYPSIPLFCIYNPSLLTGFMTGIFKFAKLPCWTFDFSPHDLGTYPRASGQTYGSPKDVLAQSRKGTKKVYTYDYNPFPESGQQPVEECGNMLIMCYVYYKLTGDVGYLQKHCDLLGKWADYLVEKGVILENQLCTDDFAGHLEKNINLAIKSVMGIRAYSEICAILAPEKTDRYADIAAKNAREIIEKGSTDGNRLLLAFDSPNTWSLKYNMVWDVIWNTGLFDEKTIQGEVDFYRTHQNKYGIPLDSRAEYTKSDWIMWSACLDKSYDLVALSARNMSAFLNDSKQKVPFSDWYVTKDAWTISFRHRSVQGGLWMPVLAKKWNDSVKK